MGRFLNGHRLSTGVFHWHSTPRRPPPPPPWRGQPVPGGRGSQSRPVSGTTPAECGSGHGRLGLSEWVPFPSVSRAQ